MDNDVDMAELYKPRWENMAESPIIEQVPSKYKLKLKYGGYFRPAKNSCRKIYVLALKILYISKSNPVFSTVFVDKNATRQSFIDLDSDDNFMVMLSMYEKEKEVTIYMTTDNSSRTIELQKSAQDKVVETDDEDESDYCPSEESYHSHLSSDGEGAMLNYEGETDSFNQKCPTIKVNSKFTNAVAFKRALNHHAITNEYDYFLVKSDPTRFIARCRNMECDWRIHASTMQDEITFEVKTMVEAHSCTRSNKGGNNRATQGWVAGIVSDKLKSDGDVTPAELRKWILKIYNVDVPYLKVFRGKEQAYTDIYGKWEDSFIKMDDFKAELLNKNPGSVVEIDFEKKGDKKHFKRFFISLAACSKEFLAGCRPYIGLDACHLKGKYNGVLAAATGIDGNNSIFPVAYSVLESENTASWTWFLESLKRAIGTPDGLVISSDMQKGLEVAIMHVYPNVEHRECIRHLYSNFKKHFRGDFFYSNLWGAVLTYHSSEHDRFMKQIAGLRENAITYLTQNHNKIWSRSKFGTISKCDYITNNISEAFNSWIGKLRYKPVLDLVDSIREKMIKRFDKKRRIVKKWNGTLVPKAKSYLNQISKNLGEYKVSRTSDTQAEVTYKTKRYEVNLLERKCSCRVWQVKGLPSVHAAALIAFTRDSDWDKYVDPYFSIEKFKEAYALDFGTISGKDQWFGHREKTCNNASSQSSGQYETSQAHNNKRRRGKKRKAHENGAD
uniref:uncharacterized protein LOC122609088 n=1 Tax=Erigeron canadensis TaxID=72917 RepID=UPI001CB8C3C3|nr:uncharacterized protein LOC122609088 [Erigeron canadensis]